MPVKKKAAAKKKRAMRTAKKNAKAEVPAELKANLRDYHKHNKLKNFHAKGEKEAKAALHQGMMEHRFKSFTHTVTHEGKATTYTPTREPSVTNFVDVNRLHEALVKEHGPEEGLKKLLAAVSASQKDVEREFGKPMLTKVLDSKEGDEKLTFKKG